MVQEVIEKSYNQWRIQRWDKGDMSSSHKKCVAKCVAPKCVANLCHINWNKIDIELSIKVATLAIKVEITSK